MTHDPLCWTYIKGLPDLTNPCDTCAKIAMIRADERKRIGDEIAAEGPWCNNPHHRDTGGPNDCPCYVFAISIARGEVTDE